MIKLVTVAMGLTSLWLLMGCWRGQDASGLFKLFGLCVIIKCVLYKTLFISSLYSSIYDLSRLFYKLVLIKREECIIVDKMQEGRRVSMNNKIPNILHERRLSITEFHSLLVRGDGTEISYPTAHKLATDGKIPRKMEIQTLAKVAIALDLTLNDLIEIWVVKPPA
jgi:hypothetical protein